MAISRIDPRHSVPEDGHPGRAVRRSGRRKRFQQRRRATSMGLVTRRTHIYAIVLFLLGLLSTPSARSVEGLVGALIGMYLFVILCQQIVRAGRMFWIEARGGTAE